MDRIARHAGQVARIGDKLVRVRAADAGCAVFGSDLHRYFTGPVLSEGEISAFETAHGIVLPDGFAAFLAGVGNGGIAENRCTAGPFYGIYPLGRGLNAFAPDGAAALKQPALFRPDMTDAEWTALNAVLEDDDISDAEWDAAKARIWGGVLPLGHQGCTAYHGLVLNGPHAGRVVNLDVDYQPKPLWPRDETFLDWYERWLDEILSGELMRRTATWFGYPENPP